MAIKPIGPSKMANSWAERSTCPTTHFLSYREEFGDFVLRFSVKLRNHNSGVQFRGRQLPDHVVTGYQADIAAGFYGNLHEEAGSRNILVDGWTGKGERFAVLDGWNTMTVQAIGPHIIITINGLTTVDYEESNPNCSPVKASSPCNSTTAPPWKSASAIYG